MQGGESNGDADRGTGGGRRRPSHYVCGCYCDISGLEEQLETVSTATEQPDTPAQQHSDSWNLPDRWQIQELSKENTTDTTDPADNNYSKRKGHPDTICVPAFSYVCC